MLNGVDTAKIFENGKLVIDAMLQPRIPEPNPEDTLVDRVLGAMWLYAMNYRLADEEKLDETSLWYAMFLFFCYIRISTVDLFVILNGCLY